MTSIAISGLHLRHPGGFALGPLDLQFAAGARVAVLGPSGCGKTTLLRCIAGLHRPEAGTISFGDRIVHGPGGSVPAEDRQVGFVFQDAALWPHLDAVQHLRFVDPKLTPKDAVALLDQVGLGGFGNRKPGTLSGGEAQRLALARALAGRPAVLLLDEPLNAVDVPLRDELCLLVHRLCERRSLTSIVVTHDRREALAMADELVVLRDGKVIEAGPAARILRAPATAYAAAFVAEAACLPVRWGADGPETPLGPLPRGTVCSDSDRLVVLPGDLVIANGNPANGNPADGNPADGAAGNRRECARGRVIRVVPEGGSLHATVEVGGCVVRVPCPPDTAAGAELSLVLRGTPRILPAGGEG